MTDIRAVERGSSIVHATEYVRVMHLMEELQDLFTLCGVNTSECRNDYVFVKPDRLVTCLLCIGATDE